MFAIRDCGFTVRSALEVQDSSDLRFQKIVRIIRGSRFATFLACNSIAPHVFHVSICRSSSASSSVRKSSATMNNARSAPSSWTARRTAIRILLRHCRPGHRGARKQTGQSDRAGTELVEWTRWRTRQPNPKRIDRRGTLRSVRSGFAGVVRTTETRRLATHLRRRRSPDHRLDQNESDRLIAGVSTIATHEGACLSRSATPARFQTTRRSPQPSEERR
jgi:hypothetical protein